ncbi:hypothetical protein HNQ80_000282 [Anaerosolibacter carboniphilus]|uniref:Uncharacterized protein n=1 Tax=Anaerosolibacter carboniphilus TaxID=1417629 RepID=A0A841KLC8_9FIRM|nr:CBO0543 family protein [Anaerosolibacter carboniphilus]MBB6214213.1 hypothetical protein [Anaerosolibacter carboniphilus]
MYLLEKNILIISFIICVISIFFIPRTSADKASLIFLATQFFSWILGLIAVEFAFLEYPVRELSKANQTSFLFEYFVLPLLTIFFILHYPNEKPIKLKLLYFATFSSIFTLMEYILEKHTMVIDYHSWKWYWTWASMSLIFYIVMVIYRWFYKIKNIFSL